MRMKLVKVTAMLLAGALAVAACGDSGSGTDPDETVELTFWTWVPNIETVVAKWNAANPNIQVSASNQAQGDELVTKLLTAKGTGEAPDLVQAEYQALPTLVSNDALADISPYVGGAESEFAPGVWDVITLGTDAVYAIPQDVGPMMLYYRQDEFDRLGLTVPKTWDEFADLAREVREKSPTQYLTTFSSADPGWFVGLAQQAGAQWWGINGDAWTVSINDTATEKVAQFWGDLVDEGAIDNQPMFTPEWNAQLNDGTLLAWPSAVWAPGVLAGNAADTAGKWAMAPMPQWSAGESKTGSWGGSSTAVTADSEHAEAATKFAIWLNTSAEATAGLVTEGGIYPAATSAQSGEALANAPEFFSNQPEFYTLAKEIAGTAQGFTFGPNVNVTYSVYKDAFAKAITDDTSFTDALDVMQTATLEDMQSSGFNVSG